MSEREDVKRLQERIRKQRRSAVNVGQARVRRLLLTAQREVLGEVAGTEWQRFFLPRMTAAVDAALNRIEGLVSTDLAEGQAANWLLGSDMTTGAIAAMNIQVALPEIPTSLLQALQVKSAETVKGLMTTGKLRINQEIANALLAGKPREEAIQSIGRVLSSDLGTFPGQKPQGVFGSIDRRARFIYQHETGQAFSTAQALRRDQVTQHVPDIEKVWVHDGHPIMSRPDHVAMHGQRVKNDEPFVNVFTGERLMFPRDPDAAIGETAGCTCDTFLYREEYGDVNEFIGDSTGTPAVAEEAA